MVCSLFMDFIVVVNRGLFVCFNCVFAASLPDKLVDMGFVAACV